MEYLIFEIGVVVIAAALLGVVLHFLRQPLILAYIFAGILIGPMGLGLLSDLDFIHGIASIGIMLLLFLVGLEMSWGRLKDLGLVSLVAGVGQVVFTGGIGFLIIQLFDFSLIQAAYLAVALTFSSTVIAVKIMSDKKETKSLYGQICIGILIVQDVLAILALLLLAGFQEGSFAFDGMHFVRLLAMGALMAVATLIFVRFMLSPLFSRVAKSHELLVILSLAWCFAISLLSIQIGFSMEIGAFLAGLSLANLPYTFEINAKAKVLQDFFITLFFVSLGAGMIFTDLGELMVPFVVLSLFVLIGNPLIVLLLMSVVGYDRRTSFLTGLAIANISEFSLIVVALGLKLGHLDEAVVSMVTLIAMLTMVLSSYMITYNDRLYRFLKPYLKFVTMRTQKTTKKLSKNLSHHIVLLGCGKTGEQVLEQLTELKDDYIVVDHDNQVIRKLMSMDIPCVFGDGEDEDLLSTLDLEGAEMVISTLPEKEENHALLRYIQSLPKSNRPIVVVTASAPEDGVELFTAGADHIVLKSSLGAEHIQEISAELYDLHAKKGVKKAGKEKAFQKSRKGDMAKIVHNLSALRLQEIRKTMKGKNLRFLRKENT